MTARTLPGIADKAGVTIRQMLDFNPTALPFRLPPQISKGLSTAQNISNTLGLRLKIPTAADLEKDGAKRYQKIIGDLLRTPDAEILKTSLGDIEKGLKVIDQISWLF